MKYDVALSFAGEDREYVEAVATELKRLGVNVFYDRFETANLWGKDLYQHLSKVYSEMARFTVIFISENYSKKLWAKHELKNAQAKAFKENMEYILPARFDDTEIDGITSTVGYISLDKVSPVELASLIIQKIEFKHISSIDFEDSQINELFTTENDIQLIPYLKGRKFGFCDVDRSIVITPKYDFVSQFSEGLASFIINDKYGFVSKTGEEIIPPKFDSAYQFTEDLAGVELNGKWSFIDKTGKEILSLKYDGVNSFSEGLASVKLGDKWGFIDKNGKEAISLKYSEERWSFKDGLALVKLGYDWGFIDKIGNVIIEFKYADAYPFSEGLASVYFRSKKWAWANWGFIDRRGNTVIEPNFHEAYSFSEGLALVQPRTLGSRRWGLIDKTGNEVITLGSYDEFGYFYSEGMTLVKLNDKWGFVDQFDNAITGIKYEKATKFSRGLSLVNYLGKWFYIDKNGKEYYEP